MSQLTKEYFESHLKEKLAPLIQDVSILKDDVAVLKTDFLGLKDDVSGLKHKVDIIEQTVIRIDKREKEDSNAFAGDIIPLQKAVKRLNSKSKILQPAS